MCQWIVLYLVTLSVGPAFAHTAVRYMAMDINCSKMTKPLHVFLQTGENNDFLSTPTEGNHDVGCIGRIWFPSNSIILYLGQYCCVD